MMLKQITKAVTTVLAGGAVGAALALAVMAGIDYIAPAPQPEVKIETVYASPGGQIYEFMEHYGKMRHEGAFLEIRGPCFSACTFALGLLPKERICADEHAQLGFHGVYAMTFAGPLFMKEYTKWILDTIYWPEVKEALKKRGFTGDEDVNSEEHPMGLIFLTPEELGIKKCS